MATEQTTTALYFSSMKNNVKGNKNSNSPVILFITVCSTINLFLQINPDITFMILIIAITRIHIRQSAKQIQNIKPSRKHRKNIINILHKMRLPVTMFAIYFLFFICSFIPMRFVYLPTEPLSLYYRFSEKVSHKLSRPSSLSSASLKSVISNSGSSQTKEESSIFSNVSFE